MDQSFSGMCAQGAHPSRVRVPSDVADAVADAITADRAADAASRRAADFAEKNAAIVPFNPFTTLGSPLPPSAVASGASVATANRKAAAAAMVAVQNATIAARMCFKHYSKTVSFAVTHADIADESAVYGASVEVGKAFTLLRSAYSRVAQFPEAYRTVMIKALVNFGVNSSKCRRLIDEANAEVARVEKEDNADGNANDCSYFFEAINAANSVVEAYFGAYLELAIADAAGISTDRPLARKEETLKTLDVSKAQEEADYALDRLRLLQRRLVSHRKECRCYAATAAVAVDNKA